MCNQIIFLLHYYPVRQTCLYLGYLFPQGLISFWNLHNMLLFHPPWTKKYKNWFHTCVCVSNKHWRAFKRSALIFRKKKKKTIWLSTSALGGKERAKDCHFFKSLKAREANESQPPEDFFFFLLHFSFGICDAVILGFSTF